MPSVLRGKFTRFTEQMLEKAFVAIMKARGLTAAQAVSSKIKTTDLLVYLKAEQRKWADVNQEHLLRKGHLMVDEINKYVETLKHDTELLKQMLAEEDSNDKTLSDHEESILGSEQERKPQVPSHAAKKPHLKDNESTARIVSEESKNEPSPKV